MSHAAATTVPATDLGRWLQGRWNVERTINRDDRFEGEATFLPLADGGLRWEEQGALTLGGHTGLATRVLTLVARDDVWQVFFDDGRFFHDLDLRSGRWNPEHPCAPDHYVGEYVVSGVDELIVTWRVSGPGREDTIRSVYTRVRQSAGRSSAAT